MAIMRVDIQGQVGIGHVWSNAENKTAALQEVLSWCEENPPWEVRTPDPDHAGGGNYRFEVVRMYDFVR